MSWFGIMLPIKKGEMAHKTNLSNTNFVKIMGLEVIQLQ